MLEARTQGMEAQLVEMADSKARLEEHSEALQQQLAAATATADKLRCDAEQMGSSANAENKRLADELSAARHDLAQTKISEVANNPCVQHSHNVYDMSACPQ